MNGDLKVPLDLFYSDDHTWILVENDVGTIGVTDYGQAELAEIVYIELPDVGARLALHVDLRVASLEFEQVDVVDGAPPWLSFHS